MKRIGAILLICALLAGCSGNNVTVTDVTRVDVEETTSVPKNIATEETVVGDTTVETVVTSGMDFTFDEEDTNTPLGETASQIDLSGMVSQTKNDSVSSATASPKTEIVDISAGGIYTFTGSKTDGMITVDAGEEDVQLILKNAAIANPNGPAIYVKSANKVVITLAENSVNTLSDGASYSITDGGSALDGALVSRADLTINGNGKLVVKGNYKHGIVSKDDLVVSSGTLQVTAAGVGMEGKDCVKVNGGNITITAGSDGIRSDNMEDVNKGFIYLYGGTLKITSGNDGVQAETVLKAENANLTVISGGGSSKAVNDDGSYKGLKAGLDIYITGGTFVIDSADDAIHSNGTVTVEGGNYTLSSGDDAIHADSDLAVSGGKTVLTVKKSREGLESTNLVIAGGTITVNATKNGIKAEGTYDVSGGMIYISCPNATGTEVLDYGTSGNVKNATVIATGEETSEKTVTSAQGVALVKTGGQAAGTTVTVKNAAGKTVLTFTPAQSFGSILLTSPDVEKGESYTVTVGDFTQTITAQ